MQLQGVTAQETVTLIIVWLRNLKGVGWKANALTRKNNYCHKILRNENRYNLAESSKEGYSMKRSCYDDNDDDAYDIQRER
jgi:hypothetical protein